MKLNTHNSIRDTKYTNKTRPGDVLHTLADVTKIKAKLGFKAKVDFEEGLRRTVEWFESQLAKAGEKNA